MINKLLKEENSLPLVIGLNQVDKIIIDGWDLRLNAPSKEAEKEIFRRSNDIINKITKYIPITPQQIEYYSALQRYRLLNLLNKIIQYSYTGFKFTDIQPADPFELADDDIKEFVEQERAKRINNGSTIIDPKNKLLKIIKQTLSDEDFSLFQRNLNNERIRPPKVAVIGKSGVGKTTTINNVFNVNWRTSSITVGTKEAQSKDFSLESGGSITIIDLPGYGRSIAEDQEYEKIYKELIPSCDLILFILQANLRDFTDDQEMIIKIIQWIKECKY
jgi:predicted GTPase